MNKKMKKKRERKMNTEIQMKKIKNENQNRHETNEQPHFGNKQNKNMKQSANDHERNEKKNIIQFKATQERCNIYPPNDSLMVSNLWP